MVKLITIALLFIALNSSAQVEACLVRNDEIVECGKFAYKRKVEARDGVMYLTINNTTYSFTGTLAEKVDGVMTLYNIRGEKLEIEPDGRWFLSTALDENNEYLIWSGSN